MDLIYYAINIGFYSVIYLHTDLLGGWDRHQMMVFVSGYLFLDAMVMTVLANNLWALPIFVNRGDLDYYLIRPVSSLFFLSLRDFSANSFVNLILTALIMAWSIHEVPVDLTAGRIVFYLGTLFLGAILYYLIRMISILPVFWTITGRGLDQLFWQVSRFMERPDRIFNGWVRRLLLSLLPFSLMASYPARFLLESFRPLLLLHMVGVILFFSAVVLLLWRIALRFYSSASS